jgi:hypothetical protein
MSMKIRATYIKRSKIYIYSKPENLDNVFNHFPLVFTNYLNIHGIGLQKHFCSHVMF